MVWWFDVYLQWTICTRCPIHTDAIIIYTRLWFSHQPNAHNKTQPVRERSVCVHWESRPSILTALWKYPIMKPAQQITSLSIQPTYLLDPSSGLNSYSLVAWDYQGFHNLVVYTHCTGSRKLNSSSQRYTQPTNFELWFGLYSYHYHLTNFPQTDVTTDTTYRTFDDPGIHHAFTLVSPWAPNHTHPHKDTQGALPLQMGTILWKSKEYSLYNP
jgi:hypothetical protein